VKVKSSPSRYILAYIDIDRRGGGGSIPSLTTIILKDLDDFIDFLQPKVQPKVFH
jgi:hypothetical protein